MKRIFLIIFTSVNMHALQEAAAQSLEAYEQWLQQFEGVRCEKSATMTFWHSPIKDLALNIVTRSSSYYEEKDILDAVALVTSYAKENKTQVSWITGKNDNPYLIKCLQLYDFERLPLALMAHPLQKLPEFYSDQIKCISLDEIPGWLNAFNESFGEESPEFTKALKSVLKRDLESPDSEVYTKHYAGYLNNKLVTTGSLYITPRYAEISNIGTIKQARNMGMATIMIGALLHHAKKLNAPHVILTAAQEAQSIYTKAGFIYVAESDRYILDATTSNGSCVCS